MFIDDIDIHFETWTAIAVSVGCKCWRTTSKLRARESQRLGQHTEPCSDDKLRHTYTIQPSSL